MSRGTRVEIDVAALGDNLSLLKAANGAAFFCPMIKANAYGHGMELVAPVVAESGADMAGVALVEEGIELRRLGVKMPVLTFAPLDLESARAVVEFKLTPVIGRIQDLEMLSQAKYSGDVHLKFNTGMQRLGFTSGQVEELSGGLKKNSRLRVAGVCTHLTHGEDAKDKDGPTARQLQIFLNLAGSFPGVRHAHKSATLAVAGGLNKIHPEIGARPGISIYGLPHDEHRFMPGLQPVLSWKTELVNVHRVEKGETVSYSGRWVAPRRSTIGVVPLGYGDGYLRALSNKGEMLFRGVRVPVIGSVCMDYTMLDLTSACEQGSPQAGEAVVVLGSQGSETVTAAQIAERAGTIAYEVVTAISRRVRRGAL